MLIEACLPLAVNTPGGKFLLDPGTPVELDDSLARRLLEQAPGKVRLVEDKARKPNPESGRAYLNPMDERFWTAAKQFLKWQETTRTPMTARDDWEDVLKPLLNGRNLAWSAGDYRGFLEHMKAIVTFVDPAHPLDFRGER